MNINELLHQLSTNIAQLSLGQKMTGGLIVTGISIGLVFLVLAALMLIIFLFSAIGSRKPSAPTDISPSFANKENTASGTAVAADAIDPAIVAAITAVLSMMLEKPQGSIKVLNIQRAAGNQSIWSQSGILQQLQTRL